MKPSHRLSVLSLLFFVTLGLGACGTGGEGSPDAEALATTASSPFYVNPGSEAKRWDNKNSGDSKAGIIRRKIANQPQAKWIGDWTSNVTREVSSFTGAAARAGKTPVFVAYNIPGRDCGNFSSGGAGSPGAYRSWIRRFAIGIGERDAVVILEPDALPLLLDCYSGEQARTVTNLLSFAVNDFGRYAPNTRVYIDAGHSAWKPPAEIAARLKAANVAKAAGFALNTSNYQKTEPSKRYGNDIVQRLGGKARFIIDTSRNGVGPKGGEWCNPAGRKLGETPRKVAGRTGLEMLLWVKAPGESDGNCGVGKGSNAGDFLPSVAFDLAR